MTEETATTKPRFYSRTDIGIEEHDTAEEAKQACEDEIEDGSDGWPENIDDTEWGVMVPRERVEAFDRRPDPSGEFSELVRYRMVAVEAGEVVEDPEVGALREEALRDAQVEAREAETHVHRLRSTLEMVEQRAQRCRARVRELSGVSIDAYLAPSNLRPEDLKRERARIPRASVRCAQWEDSERTVRLGLQLGEDGPGLWLDVSRQELGYHAAAHSSEVARLMDERDAALAGRDRLQLEVERLGRVKAAAPETLHLALREADGELERLRKVLDDVRDDLEEGAPVSALARLREGAR